ncbi:MAG TPA: UDP-N-acetylmuramoyl-L-alanyl-D-glutamate--2,6-diaminopimelate ligase [Polyangiaceae bacterium]|nr:UDP-N-acetylmuramoyl-L-alanyl-D-glutamate--2,6-diaminopimelate ligase [Polyangiaceae bacterium]
MTNGAPESPTPPGPPSPGRGGERATTLGAVAARLPGSRLIGEPSTRVAHLFHDSRRVEPGTLFAARRGKTSDGRQFVGAAAHAGAVALLTDDEPLALLSGLPALLVPDVARALGAAAAAVYGEVGEGLEVVGVTGTNGKTTTTHLIASALATCGARPALLGTLGCHFGGETLPSAHTTPEADELARRAAWLRARGATHLVMEVSSHALALGRVEGVRFRAAGFLNLTQDHLDLHGTMQAYGEAKARLFTDFAPAASVVNVDDPFGLALAGRAKGELFRVSPSGARPDARLSLGAWASSPEGSRAVARSEGREVALETPLLGEHNRENLAVALGLALALGLGPDDAARALARAPQVPGRLERCSGPGDDLAVVVDYAHSPDALARVLATLRPLAAGGLVCVFGCGGDRDPLKRPLMGEAVGRGADRAILTNDNPRGEDPRAIADATAPGLERTGTPYEIVLDRAEAIERAVASAPAGALVLIAGKGHETYQLIGGVSTPFDDRVEARRALERRRARRAR